MRPLQSSRMLNRWKILCRILTACFCCWSPPLVWSCMCQEELIFCELCQCYSELTQQNIWWLIVKYFSVLPVTEELLMLTKDWVVLVWLLRMTPDLACPLLLRLWLLPDFFLLSLRDPVLSEISSTTPVSPLSCLFLHNFTFPPSLLVFLVLISRCETISSKLYPWQWSQSD